VLAWREGNIARSAKSIYIAAGLGNKKISFPFFAHHRDGSPPRVRAPIRLCSEEHGCVERGGFKLSRVLKSMGLIHAEKAFLTYIYRH
jgi:hypothetical protein